MVTVCQPLITSRTRTNSCRVVSRQIVHNKSSATRGEESYIDVGDALDQSEQSKIYVKLTYLVCDYCEMDCTARPKGKYSSCTRPSNDLEAASVRMSLLILRPTE